MGMRRVRVRDIDDYKIEVMGNDVLLTLKSADMVIKIPVLVSYEIADQLDRAHIMWCRPSLGDDDKIDYDLLDRSH